jgi:hypothetical protein
MTSQPTPIADALGFVHEATCPDRTDDSLLFVERYIGEEARRFISIDTDVEHTVDEPIVYSITLGTDAVSDESVEAVRQWVECRCCAGAQVGVPTDVINYE